MSRSGVHEIYNGSRLDIEYGTDGRIGLRNDYNVRRLQHAEMAGLMDGRVEALFDDFVPRWI